MEKRVRPPGVALAASSSFCRASRCWATLPYFKDIRLLRHVVFYDSPAIFWGAMLAGFFVTDVLVAEKWRAHIPKIVAALAVLMLLDYWSYQKPAKVSDVPAHTADNLQTTYHSFEPDKDWVKTYSFSGRYFHLLGPMWGGKPQVYEAFYNWMAPLGTGLLNREAFSSWENHRAFLNLLSARYVVFDKTDPGNQEKGPQQILAAYRQSFPVFVENEDFVAFRNDTARPYITAFGKACLYVGDVRKSAALALALSAKNWPLVQAGDASGDQQKYEKVYGEDSSPFPPVTESVSVPLGDVQLTRDNSELVHIKLTASSPCIAVIAESYYPYWHAQVDGQPNKVLQISCGMMGLELPAGAHTIVMRYQPPKVYEVAGLISLVTLVAGLALAARDRVHPVL